MHAIILSSIVYLYETLKSEKDIIRAFDLCIFKNVSSIPVVGGLVTPDVLQELEEEIEMVNQMPDRNNW